MRFILALLLCFSSFGLPAQDASDSANLLDQVLSLKLHARLINSSGDVAWQMDNNAYTISGRTVDVRLEGSNVMAISRLTPYLNNDEGVLLVAQGEVWYNRFSAEDVKYLSGMTSIPLKLGESALFFPMGVDPHGDGESSFILEIEITVNKLSQLQADNS